MGTAAVREKKERQSAAGTGVLILRKMRTESISYIQYASIFIDIQCQTPKTGGDLEIFHKSVCSFVDVGHYYLLHHRFKCSTVVFCEHY